MSFHTAPLLAPPELLGRTSDSLEGVNEALLLGETEELLNCLEPAAFALSSSSAVPQAVKVLGNDAPGSSESTPPPTVRRRGRRCWKPDAIRNPSRERLQIELATLRQQASDLETELTLARTHREELKRSKLLLIPTWERIAKRQHRARTASEDENTRLKRLVVNQRVFVTQLQHAWHQWRKMTHLDPHSAIAHAMVRFEVTDPALFDVLTAELDLEYMRLDQVFRDAGHLRRKLDVSSASVLKSRQLSSGQVVPFVEVRAVEAEPYDYSMLTQVSWQCMHDPTFQRNRILYDGVSLPERTGAMKMRATTVHDGRQVALEMLVVSRRYVENDRTTFVWRGLLRADDGARELSDTFTEETGWITMQSMASLDEPPIAGSGENSGDNSGTLTLTCVHIEPKREHALQARGHGGSVIEDPLMNIVEQQFRTSFQRMNEMIEDRILGAVVG